MSIKKFTSLLLLMFFLFARAYAQDEKIFNKLNTRYTLDNFEDCIKKAQGYAEGRNTSKDAYPYLYMAMSYFSIYQNIDHYDPKIYKDPLRKALINAGKFLKRDKKKELRSESSDFLDQLHKATLKECAYMAKNTDWRNLQNLAREMSKEYPKDYPMQITAGTYLLYSGVKGEGEKAIQTGMDSLKKKPAITDSLLQPDYVNAFVLYTGYLVETKDTKKAKTVIKFAMDYCPGNNDLKNISDKLNNPEVPKTTH